MFHVIGIVFCCLVVADFITGLVHWWEDTYGRPSWPLIGKLVILPNIQHHARPGLIGTMSTFFSRNLQSCCLAAFAIVCFWIAGLASWPFVLTALFAAFGNEVHTWNHRAKNPAFVRFLHEAGLIQSKRGHALHHRAPYDSHFCTLTDFTNAVLESIGFWRRLEWLIAAVFRIQPQRGSTERKGY